MKTSCVKLTFCLIIILNINAFSQNIIKNFESVIWLKGISNDTIITETLNQLNYNPKVDFFNEKIKKRYNNIIEKKSNLFIVYNSVLEHENNLFSIERGLYKALISNKKISIDKDILLNRGDVKTGIILNYMYNKNSLIGRKKGDFVFDDIFFKNKKNENQLLELIYIPKLINDKERESIESYLSLKYGISLMKERNYTNSNKDTLWNAKDNDEYNNRITGIGRDDFYKLNQKQSKNSSNDGLTIGINKIKETNFSNSAELLDKTFILWGDNNGECWFEKNTESKLKKIGRVWKMKTFSSKNEVYKTQIIIDKERMPLEKINKEKEKDYIWLAIDSLNHSDFNYKNAKYVKASINNDDKIIFDDVTWHSNSTYLFTLVKSPDPINEESILKVDFSELNSKYRIYPNPVDKTDDFYIQFNLTELSDVSIKVTDVNGKILSTKDFGKIREYIYKDNIKISGTYFILIAINGVVETNKILIK
jgi:hypothetical protein